MNRTQRNSNRDNARRLADMANECDGLEHHICENCGKSGGHWITTRGRSLAAMLGMTPDDMQGFWTCEQEAQR